MHHLFRTQYIQPHIKINHNVMKKSILTLAASLLGVAISQAQPVEITITGATAFRANAFNAIVGLFDAGYSQNPAGNQSAANKVTWSGTMTSVFGSRPVTVKASYSGSAAGVQSLTANANVNFLASSVPGSTATTNQTADFAFSDVFQSSTAFLAPALEDNTAGVIPFVWVRGNTASTKLTNITAQNARGIFNLGYFPLFVLTGDSADIAGGEIVNVAGRNSGSGTRAATLSEIGLGPLATILQRKNSGLNWVDDAVGFSSSSAIPGALNSGANTSAEGPGGCISYLDLNDAGTVVAGGGAILQYDGVTYSASNVRNGKYSLWTYEHLYNRTPLAADEGTYRTALLSRIDSDLATSTSAIQTSSMLVQRLADGATVTP